MPVRIQRKRTKGWKMPANTVYVGRGSEWGNPYRIVDPTDFGHREAVQRYREHVSKSTGLDIVIREKLRGKDLSCWCPLNQACHADVLLEIANGSVDSSRLDKP